MLVDLYSNGGFGRIIVFPVTIYNGPDNQFGKVPEEHKVLQANYMQLQFTEKSGSESGCAKQSGSTRRPGRGRETLYPAGDASGGPAGVESVGKRKPRDLAVFGRRPFISPLPKSCGGQIVCWGESRPFLRQKTAWPAISARTRKIRKITSAIPKRTRAIVAVAAETPEKPKKPAMIEITKNIRAHFSMTSSFAVA